MPGLALHVGATVTCQHAGVVNAVTTNLRVTLSGQPAAVVSDQFLVAGCPFTIPGTPPKPQPCVTVRWLVPATRVRVGGQPVLLADSVGICQSVEQIPQGAPVVAATQLRVRGT
jgi:hypothetical protein